MAPIVHMGSHLHHAHQPSWPAENRQQTPDGGNITPEGYSRQQWTGPGGTGQMHLDGSMVPLNVMHDGGLTAPMHYNCSTGARGTLVSQGDRGDGGLQAAPIIGVNRDLLVEGTFMGRGYSIKRCQGFVRCDMDIDAEVVGWVIGKNGSTIKDMKHKTGCNMWVDQRALKLTITGPDLSSVEHAAKCVEAYVAAAPIKAGAVEAAVTKTLECPPHLLDTLGDRITIARIVKETHAQVVVNKKIGRVILRGDHRSVELAYQSVQATIQTALHGGLGLRVNTPENGTGSYFSGPGAISPGEGGGVGGVVHLPPSHGCPDVGVFDVPEFRSLENWRAQQLPLHMHPSSHLVHRHNHRRGSETTDGSDNGTASPGSIGGRTPISSTMSSPRPGLPYAPSLSASPMSHAGSTPGRDWSLFSGGFDLGMAALAENSSCASTPTSTTARIPDVRPTVGLQARALGSSAVLGHSTESGDTPEDGKNKDASSGTCVVGTCTSPPSPSSTTYEKAGKARGTSADAYTLGALADSEDESEGNDAEDKVARLGECLATMGLGKYFSKFAENEVDLEALGLMSDGDLADIGIPKGPRLKILNAVLQRSSQTPPEDPTA